MSEDQPYYEEKPYIMCELCWFRDEEREATQTIPYPLGGRLVQVCAEHKYRHYVLTEWWKTKRKAS